MTSEDRHEARYQRRREKRQRRRSERCAALGGLEGVFSYHATFKAGKKCCNGELWKYSVQRHRAHLFSGTAAKCRAIRERRYKFSPYNNFLLNERGKIRNVDAPRVGDRQVHKVFTKEVLEPLYFPVMIYNNGASVKGKGLAFSRKRLVKEMTDHRRRYGMNGTMIMTDGKGFFPNASHRIIFAYHEKYIPDEGLREFGDAIIQTVKRPRGVPLGVEPSQVEAIHLPSPLDQTMKCQLGLHAYGHYMDDFAATIPPDMNPKQALAVLRKKADECEIILNIGKTRLIPFGHNFTFCKGRYHFTGSGHIVVKENRKTVSRDRRKILAFRRMIDTGEMGYMNLWDSMNGMLAYLEQFDAHKKILHLRRLFYSLFGFSCEDINEFRKREGSNYGVHHHQQVQTKWPGRVRS